MTPRDPWLNLYVAILRHDLPGSVRRERQEELASSEKSAVRSYSLVAAWLTQAVDELAERQRLVLARRFGLPGAHCMAGGATLAELAARRGVSRQAIHQAGSQGAGSHYL